MSITTLTLFGVEYLVDYTFTKGYPATLEEPGYDDEFEINGISVEPSEDNQVEYKVLLEGYCMVYRNWLESDELYDMVQSELYDARNQYKDYLDSDYWDYDDNTDDIYFD